MPNIAAVLKEEISRVARKELKREILALRKAVSAQRSQIAALKRALQEHGRALRQLAKEGAARSASKRDGASERRLRFSPARLAAQRKKLGLSAREFGLLVGASALSVYNWEAGRARPNPTYLAAIAELRGAGKRRVLARLATIG